MAETESSERQRLRRLFEQEGFSEETIEEMLALADDEHALDDNLAIDEPDEDEPAA